MVETQLCIKDLRSENKDKDLRLEDKDFWSKDLKSIGRGQELINWSSRTRTFLEDLSTVEIQVWAPFWAARTNAHASLATGTNPCFFTGFCRRLKTALYKQAYDGHTAPSR